MDETASINKITLRGTITSTRMPSKNRVIYTIATDGDRGSSVFPEIIQKINSSEDIWRLGENITATCHAKSGKRKSKDNKETYFKEIHVDRINRTERILSHYFDDIPEDGPIPDDINEFIFCGTVHRIIANPGGRNIVLITLKIPEDENYDNYVEVAGFKHQAEIMKSASIGDRMAIAGSVSTLRKENSYSFDYVAKDVYLEKREEGSV